MKSAWKLICSIAIILSACTMLLQIEPEYGLPTTFLLSLLVLVTIAAAALHKQKNSLLRTLGQRGVSEETIQNMTHTVDAYLIKNMAQNELFVSCVASCRDLSAELAKLPENTSDLAGGPHKAQHNTSLSERLIREEARSAQLDAKVIEQDEGLSSSRSTNAGLVRRCNMAEGQVTSLTEKLTFEEKKNAAMVAKVNQQEGELFSFRSTDAKLRRHYSKVEKQATSLSGKLTTQETDNAQLIRDKNATEDRNGSLQMALQMIEAEYETLSYRLEVILNYNEDERRVQDQRLKRVLADRTAYEENVEKEIADLHEKTKCDERDRRKETQALKQKVTDYEAKPAELCEQFRMQEMRVATLERGEAIKKKTIEANKEIIERQAKDLQDARELCKYRKEEVQNLEKEIAAAKDRGVHLGADLNQSTDRESSMKKQIGDLQGQVGRLNENRPQEDALRTKLDSANVESRKFARELTTAHSEITKVKAFNASLEGQVAELEADKVSLAAEHSADAIQLYNDHEEDRADLKEQLTTATQAVEKLRDEIRQAKSSTEIVQANEQRPQTQTTATQAVEKLRDEIRQAKSSTEIAQANEQRSRTQIRELKLSREKFESENQALRDRIENAKSEDAGMRPGPITNGLRDTGVQSMHMPLHSTHEDETSGGLQGNQPLSIPIANEVRDQGSSSTAAEADTDMEGAESVAPQSDQPGVHQQHNESMDVEPESTVVQQAENTQTQSPSKKTGQTSHFSLPAIPQGLTGGSTHRGSVAGRRKMEERRRDRRQDEDEKKAGAGTSRPNARVPSILDNLPLTGKVASFTFAPTPSNGNHVISIPTPHTSPILLPPLAHVEPVPPGKTNFGFEYKLPGINLSPPVGPNQAPEASKSTKSQHLIPHRRPGQGVRSSPRKVDTSLNTNQRAPTPLLQNTGALASSDLLPPHMQSMFAPTTNSGLNLLPHQVAAPISKVSSSDVQSSSDLNPLGRSKQAAQKFQEDVLSSPSNTPHPTAIQLSQKPATSSTPEPTPIPFNPFPSDSSSQEVRPQNPNRRDSHGHHDSNTKASSTLGIKNINITKLPPQASNTATTTQPLPFTTSPEDPFAAQPPPQHVQQRLVASTQRPDSSSSFLSQGASGGHVDESLRTSTVLGGDRQIATPKSRRRGNAAESASSTTNPWQTLHDSKSGYYWCNHITGEIRLTDPHKLYPESVADEVYPHARPSQGANFAVNFDQENGTGPLPGSEAYTKAASDDEDDGVQFEDVLPKQVQTAPGAERSQPEVDTFKVYIPNGDEYLEERAPTAEASNQPQDQNDEASDDDMEAYMNEALNAQHHQSTELSSTIEAGGADTNIAGAAADGEVNVDNPKHKNIGNPKVDSITDTEEKKRAISEGYDELFDDFDEWKCDHWGVPMPEKPFEMEYDARSQPRREEDFDPAPPYDDLYD